MYNCCIFLDLTKAFDTVNHNVLLHKMKNFCGFRGLATKLIQSCLSNRKQYTKGGKLQERFDKNLKWCATGFFPWATTFSFVYQ